jgi:formate dehydrogenase subunit gamma
MTYRVASETSGHRAHRLGRRLIHGVGLAAGVVALMLLALPSAAQQPGQANPNVRPPANAVQNVPPSAATPDPADIANREMWHRVRKGVQGQVSIPDKKLGQLVQSEGEEWRNLRNGPLARYGVWAMAGMLALLAIFYLLKGPIRVEHGFTGRTITRFNTLDRMGHWLTAVSFIILGLTGLNVLYGRYVLLPLVGKEAFGTISLWGKWLHNYVAFAFMAGIVLIFLLWIKHNLPTRADATWLARGGGIIGHGHPPAHKFNAGQKILFWLIIIGGVSISLSGLSLMLPYQMPLFAKTFAALNVFGLGLPTDLTPVQEMQYASTWHAIMALFLVCVIFAHIYIGTLGMQGAFSAMGSGEVDVNWAKEHHNLWAAEELKAGKEHPGPSARPAPAE